VAIIEACSDIIVYQQILHDAFINRLLEKLELLGFCLALAPWRLDHFFLDNAVSATPDEGSGLMEREKESSKRSH